MAGETKVLTIGQAASALDIFLSANGAAVSGQYVGFELFDAANVSAVSGVALNPSLGRYVGSGTIPAGFQLGTWRVDWTIITVGNSLATATEPFCVQDVNIAIGFVDPSDKTSDIYEAVRLDIGDPEGQVFDDDFMGRNLKKAVRRLNHRLGLSPTNRPKGIPGNFGGPRIKVSPITFDLTDGTISPNNDEICDLVVMQIELIILESEVSALKRLAATSASGPYASLVAGATQDGLSVKNADGVMVSISPSRLNVRADLHKFDIKNRREELERMIRAFLNRQTGNYGKMIY
ncbi:MAG: hypothetical protein K5880_13980 [Hydrogenophaga sp.]|uniref:hypothetical protein n=1 Tax=Hydrogenophaga sp. TaxID=1904254 RepID=UPI002619B55A|nr:hypothetical protein [Hydrogenophaga sp.]MCV0439731.1 hypothetical protein [Hydrogenophaga sp.]